MKRLPVVLVVLGTVAATMTVAQPAAAAPPPNDTPSGATLITGLPFTDDIDTSEATTDQAELDAIAPCVGVPAVERAVWYVAQVTTDAAIVRTDVTESDYSAGIAVFIGEPTADAFALCEPGTISGPVSGGQTIYVMVFGDTVGDPGARLRLTIEAVEPPTVTVMVDPVADVDARTGVAVVSGTVACTGDVSFLDVSGTLRQRAGRVFVQGPIFVEVPASACDGSPVAWTSSVTAPLGLFKGGKASATVTAFACTASLDCVDASAEAEVSLRGRPR
jgi:hypothetical protein